MEGGDTESDFFLYNLPHIILAPFSHQCVDTSISFQLYNQADLIRSPFSPIAVILVTVSHYYRPIVMGSMMAPEEWRLILDVVVPFVQYDTPSIIVT